MRIFVRNLPWTVGKRELKSYFSQFGRISNATVVFDKGSGFSKGYGFVSMSSEKTLVAINSSSHELEGRKVQKKETDDMLSSKNESGEYGCLSYLRSSRKLILIIVAIGLLLDNMLLTTVVPIIPDYLYQLRHKTDKTDLPDVPKPVSQAQAQTTPTNERPYFILDLPPQKETLSYRYIEGTTLVPNDVFWSFSSISPSNVSMLKSWNDNKSASQKKSLRHKELVSESFEIGILFASKPFMQALTNPFIGPLSNRIGYSIPMFAGFCIMFAATLIFAIGNDYAMLFVARSLQGIGSACTSVAGMGMLAAAYPQDDERGNAMAIALGGLALGVLIGPVFGGAMYEFVGKASPFLVLAALILADGALQLLVLQPRVVKQKNEGTPLVTLLKDPYIIIAAGAICFSNLGISVLEPSLPLWMMDTMDATKWQQGVAFLPASVSYLIGTNVFGPLGNKMGRWLAAMTGMIIIGVCLLCVPLAKSVGQLIPANAGIGFAIGMVDSSMMPMLGYLVDIRHTSVYGSVYAIADASFCIGFIIGPVFSASIVERLGFDGLVYVVSFISFLYVPFLVMLRNPPVKNEKNSVLNASSVKYSSFTSDDIDESRMLKAEDKEHIPF